jgi:hypothetical protein
MTETVQQYIGRLTGLVGDKDPWDVMARMPRRLRAFVSGATPRELAWTPSPGRWSVRQIAAHLADAEIVGAWRFRSLLASDGVTLQAYDQDKWASAFRYETRDPAKSVDLFDALRTATLELLRTVDPGRLDHVGLHEERGRESIRHLMRMYAGHDLNHLDQIERLLNEARRAS